MGHSMGGRALSRALMLVADELNHAERPVYCDVILAAPVLEIVDSIQRSLQFARILWTAQTV